MQRCDRVLGENEAKGIDVTSVRRAAEHGMRDRKVYGVSGIGTGKSLGGGRWRLDPKTRQWHRV